MNITGILLAAGMSTRMPGINKLTLPFRSGTVVEQSLANLAASAVSGTIVVLGHDCDVIADLLRRFESDSVRLLTNNDYRTGRASSVRCGIEHLGPDGEAALFMVADKPGVGAELISRAVEEFRKHRPLLLCVRTPEGRGHPVIFARELFGELVQLEGDEVGRELMNKYRDKTLWLDDDRPQINVNTREDYQRLIEWDKPSVPHEVQEKSHD